MSAEGEPSRVRGKGDWIAGVCTMLTKARWVEGRPRRVFVDVEDGGGARAGVAHPRGPWTPRLSLKSSSGNVAKCKWRIPGRFTAVTVFCRRLTVAFQTVSGRLVAEPVGPNGSDKQKQNQKKL